MQYYSETLKKVFKTEAECLAAELSHEEKLKAEKERAEKLTTERKNRAKEVEDAYNAVVTAQKNYNQLKNKFIDDYGAFHFTFSTKDDNIWSFFEDYFKVF